MKTINLKFINMSEKFSKHEAISRAPSLISRAAILATLATPACVYPTPELQRRIDEACAEDPQALIGTQGSFDDGRHAHHLNCEGESAYEARYGMVGQYYYQDVALATTAPFEKREEVIRLMATTGGTISMGRYGVVVINREGKPIFGPINVQKEKVRTEYYLLKTYEGETFLFKHGQLFAKYDDYLGLNGKDLVMQDGKWHLLDKDGRLSMSFEKWDDALNFAYHNNIR